MDTNSFYVLTIFLNTYYFMCQIHILLSDCDSRHQKYYLCDLFVFGHSRFILLFLGFQCCAYSRYSG